MILVEIGEPSPHTALFEPSTNEEELRANLDMLEEIREIAHVKEYAVKARAARKYDKWLVPRRFRTTDLVLRRVTRKGEVNKLTPLWEGPFRILEEVGGGAYRLEHLDENKVPRTWNAASLRIIWSTLVPDKGRPMRPVRGYELHWYLITVGPRVQITLVLDNGRSMRPVWGYELHWYPITVGP
ncbi:hypothetical protein CR513_48391, partial [Mucuna pruriens]